MYLLSTVSSGCSTISDGLAATGVKLLSMDDNIYTVCLKNNLPYDTQPTTACLSRTLVRTLCVHLPACACP